MYLYFINELTVVVIFPTAYGARIPGSVANVLDIPNNIPEK